MAVIAATLAMSSQSAPRERSLAGRREALQDRPEGLGPTDALRDLVGDVAGVEAREDEDVGLPGDDATPAPCAARRRRRRRRRTAARRRWRGRGAAPGRRRTASRTRATDVVLGRALRRERQEGDARRLAGQEAVVVGRVDPDRGQLVGGRERDDAAVGVRDGLSVREHHQEERRHEARPRARRRTSGSPPAARPRVLCTAPATQPSASPAATIASPK